MGGMDLLKIRLFRRLLKSPLFPLIPRIVLLIVFLIIAFSAITVNTSDMSFAKVLRNTNLDNLLIWAYWWPLMVIIAILFGRIWCTVCPMELVTFLFSRVGLKRKVPSFLRSGYGITILYGIVLLIGVHTLAIHRVPMRMAIYLLFLLGLASFAGFIFERRAFCRYLCPVGYLLGLYAHISPFEYRVRDEKICEQCKDKPCIRDENAYKLVGRSCGNFLYPPKLTHNGDCILCGECYKVCPNDNIRFSTRPLGKDLFARRELSTPEAIFILIVSGFIIDELIGDWEKGGKVLHAIPGAILSFLKEGMLKSFADGVILFLVIPFILIGIPGIFYLLRRKKATFGGYLRRYSLAYLPIVAFAHGTKALLKMTSRLPYIKLALADPRGMATAKAIFSDKMRLGSGIISLVSPFTTILSFLFIGVGVFLSLFIAVRQARREEEGFALAPVLGVAVYSALFVFYLIMSHL